MKADLRFGRSGLATVALCATIGGGCTWLHPVAENPPPPIAVPSQYATATGTAAEARGPWWTTLQDPALDRVMQAVFQDNLTLKQAHARLAQAQATLDGANAGFWPTVDVSASVTGSRNVFNFGGGGPGGGGTISVEQAQYNLSLGAAYELDLWGRVAATANAAELEFTASQQDLHSASMSVSAQVAEVWFQLGEQIATERLLEAQVERNETQLDLMETRFFEGLANAVDVFQQRQALAGAKAQLPPVRARRQVLQHQLAVLLGQAPGSRVPLPAGAVSDLPREVELGIPADLVTQRPDVRAAQLRVMSADHRVGAALAARFPTLRLTASTGFRSFDLGELFDNWLWNLVAGLTAPIFDGGRLAANQRLAEAQLEERVVGYAQVVLTAFREVEDALTQEQQQVLLVKELDGQLAAARTTYDEAYSRYVNGLSEYLPVLTALREVQGLERSQIAARRQLLSFRVQLHRALGGTWMQDLEPPEMFSAKDGEDS